MAKVPQKVPLPPCRLLMNPPCALPYPARSLYMRRTGMQHFPCEHARHTTCSTSNERMGAKQCCNLVTRMPWAW